MNNRFISLLFSSRTFSDNMFSAGNTVKQIDSCRKINYNIYRYSEPYKIQERSSDLYV